MDAAWRFAIIVFFIARLSYVLWSWIILTLQPLAVQNIDLAGEPVLTIFHLEGSWGHTYLREVAGQTLTFRAAGKHTVADHKTGSIWEIATGRSIAGPYMGSRLSPSQAQSSDLFPYHRATPYPFALLALWQRFDANWYTSVAENGYGGVVGDDHFPPLYPLLIRIVKPLFGNAFLAGLLIGHLATLYTIKLLYETFGQWGESRLAKRTTLLFLLFPTSFFLFSVYTESVFLVSTLLAFRQLRRQSWAWAGFWTFCAILTRLQGAALIVPMVYLMWQDRPFLRRLSHWIGLALPAFGGLFYLFLRSRQVADGAIPFVEPEWHARIVPPWETYGYAIQTMLSGQFTFIDLCNWAAATLFILLVIAGWRRIPVEHNLYAVFSLLIILIRIVETQPLISMSRYSLALFPCFFVLGWLAENPLLRRLIVYSFIPLNLFLSAQFFSWGWVA
ncbi:MAG TPA: glycosyltransferase family 39 protein [Anaerolineales bacterium]|nr:glycosyltransferase family 39 protein [Anaerolineales bacterium]